MVRAGRRLKLRSPALGSCRFPVCPLEVLSQLFFLEKTPLTGERLQPPVRLELPGLRADP